jgi:hypothetical protein
MFNGALHEGLADVTSAFIQDDPVIGKGFFGPATNLRTIDNAMRWPEDASGDPHVTGLIIAGAFWDLREAISLPLANQLVHFARYGIPDDADDGVAMSEYFVETLLVDDDDANLANGTPHFNEIVTAFNAHGIGTGFFVDYGHTPLADQAVSSDYPVTAVIQFTGPVGALDSSSPQLHYSINGAAYVAIPMTPAGPPDQFTASIPGQPAAIIRYYFSASDIYGASSTDPPVAPARSTYQFLAGPASTVFTQTMEVDPGWVVGSPADNATSGIWERGNPNGTLVNGVNAQPENDHTQGSGTLCWFTGQHPLGEPNVGFNDVDGGRTTLTSNTFDALTGTNYPVIEYYRWYSNQLGGSPLSDDWRSYVSNDNGTTWVPVENTAQGESDWVRILFFVDDYVTPTTTMKLRFVAQDSAGGSLVEAGVDDVRLLTYPLALAVGEPATPRPGLALAPASPNPMQGRTVLRFTLPARGRATLGVYDLHGRAVRSLIDRELQAGPHTEEWDGLDARGRRVASGPYFIKLEHGGEVALRKVVRVE